MTTNKILKVMNPPSFALGTRIIYIANPAISSIRKTRSMPRTMKWLGYDLT